MGIELVADRATRAPFPRAARVTEAVVRAARERGLLVYSGTGNADGTNGDTILLGPPFVVTEPELEQIAALPRRGRRRGASRAWGRPQPEAPASGSAGSTTAASRRSR